MSFASSIRTDFKMSVLFINVAITHELPLDLKQQKKIQKLNHLSVYINQITNYILPSISDAP